MNNPVLEFLLSVNVFFQCQRAPLMIPAPVLLQNFSSWITHNETPKAIVGIMYHAHGRKFLRSALYSQIMLGFTRAVRPPGSQSRHLLNTSPHIIIITAPAQPRSRQLYRSRSVLIPPIVRILARSRPRWSGDTAGGPPMSPTSPIDGTASCS